MAATMKGDREAKTKKKRKAGAAIADASAAADIAALDKKATKKEGKQPADQEAQLTGEQPIDQQQHAGMAAGSPASQGAAADEPAAHKKRRRKKKGDDEQPADASPEELARRAYQRERQELARRLQTAGRPYKRQKPQKAQAAKRDQPNGAAGGKQQNGSGNGQPGSGQGATGRGSKEAPWETGDRPDHPVAVIIVPIFWLKRGHEMKEVLQAADAIRKILADSDIDVGVDSTTPMSPGQKYRYWEMQGVKVRLEVGPKEAQEGGCIFSVSTKPGEVATKTAMQVSQQLLDAVRKQLQLPAGDAAVDAAVLRQHSRPAAPLHGSGAGGRGGGSSNGTQLNIGRLSGSKGRDAGPAGKHTVFGGDDLDDDFQAPEPELQPTAKAKKKKRMAAPLDVAPFPQPTAPGKKAAKLIKF